MVLKKLIAISVVFALVVGAVFAVDLGGSVIGTVNFLEGDSGKKDNGDGKPIDASASMNRIRLEGSGENDDGTFGGWIRAEAGGFAGHAWWKPIDQLKLWIGSNGGDGFFAKEGVTGWMFYQTPADTGVVNPGNTWGGGYGPVVFREAFYGGGIDGGDAFYMTISPAEIVDINIEVPFFDNKGDDIEGKAAYIFKRTVAQLDFKLDFGNIALTYRGAGNTYDFSIDMSDPDDLQINIPDDADAPKLFAYFGLTSIENLGIDVGVGFPLPVKNEEFEGTTVTRSNPIAAGLGAKFTAGDFGIKARVVASFAGSTKVEVSGGENPDPLKDPLLLTADILPFFGINDSLTVFFSAGLGITGASEENEDWVELGKGAKKDAVVAWHINPYVQVGSEWGPKFLAGIKLWSDGADYSTNNKDKADEVQKVVKWAVPLAISVSF